MSRGSSSPPETRSAGQIACAPRRAGQTHERTDSPIGPGFLELIANDLSLRDPGSFRFLLQPRREICIEAHGNAVAHMPEVCDMLAYARNNERRTEVRFQLMLLGAIVLSLVAAYGSGSGRR